MTFCVVCSRRFLTCVLHCSVERILRTRRCCVVEGTNLQLHVMSAGSSPCTVSTNVSSTLALVCSADVTSPQIDDVVKSACAVHWQRLSTSGRHGNVTSSSSAKYSVWKIDRPSSSKSDDEDSAAGVVNVLQIAAVQRDDFTTFVLTC